MSKLNAEWELVTENKRKWLFATNTWQDHEVQFYRLADKDGITLATVRQNDDGTYRVSGRLGGPSGSGPGRAVLSFGLSEAKKYAELTVVGHAKTILNNKELGFALRIGSAIGRVSHDGERYRVSLPFALEGPRYFDECDFDEAMDFACGKLTAWAESILSDGD